MVKDGAMAGAEPGGEEATEYPKEVGGDNEHDAGTMSPRKSIAESEKVGSEARAALEVYASGLSFPCPLSY